MLSVQHKIKLSAEHRLRLVERSQVKLSVEHRLRLEERSQVKLSAEHLLRAEQSQVWPQCQPGNLPRPKPAGRIKSLYLL